MQQQQQPTAQGFAPPPARPSGQPQRTTRARGARAAAQVAGSGGGDFHGKSPKAGQQAHDGEAVRERFEGQFFKTKLCVFWEKGRCVRGGACKYAHGGQELQDMPDLTNTAMCRTMADTGRCDRPGCLYAHNHESLRATDNFYKTTMCSFFRYGRCRLGALCRHAHSEGELRKAQMQAKADAEQLARAERAQQQAYQGQPRVQGDNSSTSASGGEGDNLNSSDYSGNNRQISDELDDDLDLAGSASAWDRVSTMPATLVHSGHGATSEGIPKSSTDDNLRRDRNIGRRGHQINMKPSARSKLLWADLQEEDDDDLNTENPPMTSHMALPVTAYGRQESTQSSLASYDSLPEMTNDMWARMQTAPAMGGRAQLYGAGPSQHQQFMQPKQQVVMMLMPVAQAQAMMAPGTPHQPMMTTSYNAKWEECNQGAVMMQASMMDGGYFGGACGRSPMQSMCVPAAMCLPMKEQVYHAANQVLGS